MSSPEFTRWIAWYRIADGRDEKRESTEEETVARLRGWAAAHNAKLSAMERR